LACVLEATARKPGNVHRYADFVDATYLDFVLSAAAVAPVFEQAAGRPVGETVLAAVWATRRLTATNTNLGIVLLLAPLAAVPPESELRSGVRDVLAGLTVGDSRDVFAAIRLARPGGLGDAPEQDVRGEPSLPLREVMALAADRDRIARQYAYDYVDVFDVGLPSLTDELRTAADLEAAVIGCQLRLLAAFPDSLIARKRGSAEAVEASRRARAVLDAGDRHTDAGRRAAGDFDAWLRADGHSRNPGTTADLVTACLFAALRDGSLPWPSAWDNPNRLDPPTRPETMQS
jgi:triphosphoribosyl-dephospho-CoA synthase